MELGCWHAHMEREGIDRFWLFVVVAGAAGMKPTPSMLFYVTVIVKAATVLEC